MSSLGISVYPDLADINEIKTYMKLASSCGADRVFSSMFSVEGTKEEVLDYFRDFITAAHDCGMKVSLDVNPPFLAKLGASFDDISLFHEIGCDILRMDLSYGMEKDLVLCRNPYHIQIQLNASSGIEAELRYLKENGVTDDILLLGHNFYPQRYTGLRWDQFLAVNRSLKKYGYPIDAFIASHAENTHGVWDAKDGLPSVERMRDMNCDLAYRIMEHTGVDNIFFGNAFASEEEFEAIRRIRMPERKASDSPLYGLMKQFGLPMPEKLKETVLKVECDPGITDEEMFYLTEVWPQTDFGDSSEWIWRSRAGRFLNSTHPVPMRKAKGAMFERGDIVIVNDSYRHYAGEIQIVRMPVRNDGQRNLLGRLAEGEKDLFELVEDGTFVRFMPV